MPLSFFEKVKAKLAGKFGPKVGPKTVVVGTPGPAPNVLVGTAASGPKFGTPHVIHSVAELQEVFGAPDAEYDIDPATVQSLKKWKDHVEDVPPDQQAHVAQMLENTHQHVKKEKKASAKHLMGFKGEDFKEALAAGQLVWAPYMPLYTTPALMPEDVPEKTAKAYADKPIDEKLVSVQPLTKKTGGIFFVDYELGGGTAKKLAATLQKYGYKVAGKI